MKLSQNEESIEINLEKEITFASLQDQYNIYFEAINSGKTIYLECGVLEQADPASLQLLISVVLELKKNKIDFFWKNVPDKLLETAKMLGMQYVLELPVQEGNLDAN